MIARQVNPKHGNATYILEEDLQLGRWQEILAVKRQTAREFGARALTHVGIKGRDYHKQRILTTIDETMNS